MKLPYCDEPVVVLHVVEHTLCLAVQSVLGDALTIYGVWYFFDSDFYVLDIWVEVFLLVCWCGGFRDEAHDDLHRLAG